MNEVTASRLPEDVVFTTPLYTGNFVSIRNGDGISCIRIVYDKDKAQWVLTDEHRTIAAFCHVRIIGRLEDLPAPVQTPLSSS